MASAVVSATGQHWRSAFVRWCWPTNQHRPTWLAINIGQCILGANTDNWHVLDIGYQKKWQPTRTEGVCPSHKCKHFGMWVGLVVTTMVSKLSKLAIDLAWLHTKMVCPSKMVVYPSTNWARSRKISLIHQTTSPLCHTDTCSRIFNGN